MLKIEEKNKIPAYVSSWTDKYFHQSAYDLPVKFPSQRIIKFFTQFKLSESVKLYRGINKYNKDNYTGVESWTYNKNVAGRYAKESSGKIFKKIFTPDRILFDTTLLNKKEKIMLGYDYSIDDKEVLILSK